MKNLSLFAVFCFSLNAAIAQNLPDYELMSSKLVSFYNNTQYDSIWYLYSKEMQDHLPMDKNSKFFSDVMSGYGKIYKTEFDHQKSKVVVYKMNGEQGVMALNMVLDKDLKIAGFTITQYVPGDLPNLERNATKLILPFNGEWTVFWGGDTKDINYHVESRAQKDAFDILIFDKDGKSHKSDGKNNEDYFAFGQPIIAPCDAEVMQAVDGIKDNKPGDKNPIFLTGNSVILKTANNEYMLIAHLRDHSVKVKEGDKVKQGQLLGYCGNSGNSTEPHLHFHIQNVEDMNIATGAKCYFDRITVNGGVKTDYSPIKGDRVRNVE